MIRLRALNQDLIIEEQTIIYNLEVVEVEFVGHDSSGDVWAVFNNKIRHKLEGNSITIPTVYLKEPKLSIKLITKVGDYMRSYTIDSLPLRRCLIVGDSIDVLYPEKIKHMENRIRLLEEALAKKLTEGEIF